MRPGIVTLLKEGLFLNAFYKVQGTTLGEESGGGGGGQRIVNNSLVQPEEEEKSITTDREKEANSNYKNGGFVWNTDVSLYFVLVTVLRFQYRSVTESTLLILAFEWERNLKLSLCNLICVAEYFQAGSYKVLRKSETVMNGAKY